MVFQCSRCRSCTAITAETEAGKNERGTVFAERILDKAADASPGHPLDIDLIEQQLIDVYIDGLLDNITGQKIMRGNLATFAAAVEIAVNETRLHQKFASRNKTVPTAHALAPRRHEPMEVEALGDRRYRSGQYDCPAEKYFEAFWPIKEDFMFPKFN